MPAQTSLPFPALYLYPLNDSFIPKHISLIHGQRVKIGRQTNAKTTPGERNGYFDSKVLSRQHAEVWEENGKIYIRDVKSSNGTFINGERLSSEGIESEPFELKSDDIVEFGIDIVGEDNKTIVHHKVAARVVCVFSEQDAQMAGRAEQHQMAQMHPYPGGSSPMNASNTGTINQAGPSSAGPGSASSFNFSGQQPPRRPQLQQGISGMGGMGGSMRPPGKSGLTFDHIINRLQGELQKSRETGAELHSVASTMNEIHDTLAGGNLPANAPPNPHNLPPVRQPSQQQPPQTQPSDAPPAASPPQPEVAPSKAPNESSTTSDSSSPSSALLIELQNQLKETQASLSLHVEKIRALEGVLKEQDAMRNEVDSLREMMKAVQHRELSQRSIDDSSPEKSRRPSSRDGFDMFDEHEEDFDDSQSIATVMGHELERVEEEDEDQILASDDEEPQRERVDELDMAFGGEELGTNHIEEEVDAEQEEQEQEERRQRQEELGRPRTPEPTGLGMNTRESRTRSKTLTASSRHPSSLQQSHVPPSNAVIDELNNRLATLTSQLESALELSSSLQAQHSTAQTTIASLESKVESLETLVKATLSAQQQQPVPPPVIEAPAPPPVEVEEEKPSPEELARESLTSMIMEWKKSVEGQWSNVQEEWNQERERLSRAREEWENKTRLVDAGLEQMERIQKIVSLRDDTYLNGNGDASSRHGISGGLVTPPSPRSLSSDSNRPRRRRSGSGRGRTGLRKRSLSRGADTDDTEATLANDEPSQFFDKTKIVKKALHLTGMHSPGKEDDTGVRSLVTPEPSLNSLSMSGVSFEVSDTRKSSDPLPPVKDDDPPNHINVHTAMGVLVLSVAAAAVVWRVKPET